MESPKTGSVDEVQSELSRLWLLIHMWHIFGGNKLELKNGLIFRFLKLLDSGVEVPDNIRRYIVEVDSFQNKDWCNKIPVVESKLLGKLYILRKKASKSKKADHTAETKNSPDCYSNVSCQSSTASAHHIFTQSGEGLQRTPINPNQCKSTTVPAERSAKFCLITEKPTDCTDTTCKRKKKVVASSIYQDDTNNKKKRKRDDDKAEFCFTESEQFALVHILTESKPESDSCMESLKYSIKSLLDLLDLLDQVPLTQLPSLFKDFTEESQSTISSPVKATTKSTKSQQQEDGGTVTAEVDPQRVHAVATRPALTDYIESGSSEKCETNPRVAPDNILSNPDLESDWSVLDDLSDYPSQYDGLDLDELLNLNK